MDGKWEKLSVTGENKSHMGKTSANCWDYTVAEFRQITADHGLPATWRMMNWAA